MRRLGIALAEHELRAVLVRKGTVAWRSAVDVRGVESLAAAVEALFVGAPVRVYRARVGVCVGPAWVQVKQLHGLPPLNSARLMTQLVRENHQAFFISRCANVAIAGVHLPAEGGVWGAAFDRDAVEELTRVLREKRLRVSRIVPSAILPATSHTIEGEDADAAAAAMAPPTVPLAWLPPPDAAHTRALTMARNLSTALALTAAAGFAAFGPGLRARAFTRRSAAELSGLRRSQKDLTEGDAELRRVTQMLNRIQSFNARPAAVSLMLGELVRAIPESTAMLTFHVDSAEGSFTAIAPHVADVLPELASVAGIETPRIVGSVTREVIGGAHVERAMFRFRRPRRAK